MALSVAVSGCSTVRLVYFDAVIFADQTLTVFPAVSSAAARCIKLPRSSIDAANEQDGDLLTVDARRPTTPVLGGKC